MTREEWTPEDLQRLERLKSRIEAPEDPRWTPEALRDIERVIETVTSGHGLTVRQKTSDGHMFFWPGACGVS